MKTAKQILYEHAAKNNDGFLSGQMKWLEEAMKEYADLKVDECRNEETDTLNKLMDRGCLKDIVVQTLYIKK